MNVKGGCLRMPGLNPYGEKAKARRLAAAKGLVAAVGLAVGMAVGLPVLMEPGGSNFPVLTFGAGASRTLLATALRRWCISSMVDRTSSMMRN